MCVDSHYIVQRLLQPLTITTDNMSLVVRNKRGSGRREHRGVRCSMNVALLLVLLVSLHYLAHMHQSWHTHTCKSHGTHTHGRVMAHTHMEESWHTHTCKSHGTHTHVSHGTHTHARVMAHTHMESRLWWPLCRYA